jgi:hypothetical protein
MNAMKDIVQAIQSAGLDVEVDVRDGRDLLNVQTDEAGRQRFVLSPWGGLWRKPRHLHIRNVNRKMQMVLMEVETAWSESPEVLLFGKDERYFITGVPSHVQTIEDALKHLVPNEVIQSDTNVKRQGDWFFVPITNARALKQLNRRLNKRYAGSTAMLGDHHAEECVQIGKTIFVRGDISHGEHRTLHLNGWHKAIRNRAIRDLSVLPRDRRGPRFD